MKSQRLRGRAPWRHHMKLNGRPKRAYSERDARKAADAFGQKPYQCGICGCWHLAGKKR